MKKLQCELCGSVDLIEQDGFFVCQACGVRYSPGEAEKRTVEICGKVKPDTSKELENLYRLARRAKDDVNRENAAKYYDMILIKDPSSWEAAFYAVYFKEMACKVAQMRSAAKNVANCIDTVLELICENVCGKEEQGKAYTEVAEKTMTIARMLFAAAKNCYTRADDMWKLADCLWATTQCAYTLGNELERVFGSDEKATDLSLSAWKQGIEWHQTVIFYKSFEKKEDRETVQKYAAKIKKYDPCYTVPQKGGCYVASCVYGSYDCPQVWTLRRFRDETLAVTLWGRAFVRAYYAVSPVVVRIFGNTRWFKKAWKKRLDKLVANLKAKGVKDTPYRDLDW